MILARGTKCTAVIKSDLPPPPSLSFLLLINCRSILALRSRESRSGNSLPRLDVLLSLSHLFLPDHITLISFLIPSCDYAFLFFRSNNRVIPRIISSLLRSSCSVILNHPFLFHSFCLFVFRSCARARAITIQTVLVRRLLSHEVETRNRAHDLSGRKWSSRGYAVVPDTIINNRSTSKNLGAQTIRHIYRRDPVSAFCPHTRSTIPVFLFLSLPLFSLSYVLCIGVSNTGATCAIDLTLLTYAR